MLRALRDCTRRNAGNIQWDRRSRGTLFVVMERRLDRNADCRSQLEHRWEMQRTPQPSEAMVTGIGERPANHRQEPTGPPLRECELRLVYGLGFVSG
ncbi:MAG: hypothetical protein JO057_08725 [Chloroflexi bacterium]|nr:hypothetical protein [Chloroflexota bacterium]